MDELERVREPLEIEESREAMKVKKFIGHQAASHDCLRKSGTEACLRSGHYICSLLEVLPIL